MAGHRVSEMGVTRWFRIPRCYVWEATKWINEREKRARMEKGIGRRKDKEKCQDGEERRIRAGAGVHRRGVRGLGVEGRGKGRKKKGPGNNWPRPNARAALIFSRGRTRKPFYAHPRLIILHTRKMKLAANKGTPRALLGGPRARG